MIISREFSRDWEEARREGRDYGREITEQILWNPFHVYMGKTP